MSRQRDTANTQISNGGPVSPYIAGKNALINGGMDIWQRGTATGSITTGFVYGADRWCSVSGATTAMTVSRQATGDTTNLPNIQYCARVQRTAGQTGTSFVQFGQSLESVNSIPFAGKTVTLSFYARAGSNYSSASNLINIILQTGTGTDQQVLSGFTGSSNPINTSATLTTTWQRFTFTTTLSSSLTQIGVDLFYTPTGTAGANDYFEVTGVQLELGPVATPFSRAGGTIQGELANCKRYLPTLALGTGNNPLGYSASTTTSYINISFDVQARVAPTGVYVPAYADFRLYNKSGSFGAPTGITINSGGQNVSTITVTTTAGSPTIAVGEPATLYFNGATALMYFTGCEL